jgi:type I restriction enzyme R subunit
VSAEQAARQTIDKLLAQASWVVQDFKQADIRAARGVAIREFVLNEGHGFAEYLLYVDGKAAGVIEAKKEGATLTGVEIQSARYAQGLPASLPAWRRPPPFANTGVAAATHFTNGLGPKLRARTVIAFRRANTIAVWFENLPQVRLLTIGGSASGNQTAFESPAARERTGNTVRKLGGEWWFLSEVIGQRIKRESNDGAFQGRYEGTEQCATRN